MTTITALSYPLIMIAALAAGWLLLRRSQSKLAIPEQHKLAIGLSAFLGAMLGAKLPFALSDWDALRSGVAWFSNGKTILTGIVGAYVSVELTKWIFEIRTKTGDSFAVPTAVAIGIGRTSCFVAGCCHGTPTTLPWGVKFALADAGAVARHPTQLYESAFHLTMAGVLVVLGRTGWWRGQLVKFYIMAYLVYRFFSEFIRPEPQLWGGLTSYQWFSLLCLPVFAGLWWFDVKRASDHCSVLIPSNEVTNPGTYTEEVPG